MADGVFALVAPAPGAYRVRIGPARVTPPLTLATAGTVAEHEYAVGPLQQGVRGAALDEALRSGRPLLRCEVDVEAASVPDTIRAEYPAQLRSERVRGSVVAQFVIDTAGRWDRTTFRDWRTRDTDEAFVASVRWALDGGRFRPAVVAGRRVPALVAVPFTFAFSGGPEPTSYKVERCGPIEAGLPPEPVPATGGR